MGSALVTASLGVVDEVSIEVATSLVGETPASNVSTVGPASPGIETTIAVEPMAADDDSSCRVVSLVNAAVVSESSSSADDVCDVGSRVVVGWSLVANSDCDSVSELRDEELDVAAVVGAVSIGSTLVDGGVVPCEHAATTVMTVRGIAERRAQSDRVIGAA